MVGQKMKTKRNLRRSKSTVGRLRTPTACALEACRGGSGGGVIVMGGAVVVDAVAASVGFSVETTVVLGRTRVISGVM